MGRHSHDDGIEPDWQHDRLGAARRGHNPMVLARMRSGWAVMGDTQFLPGYCVLIADADDVSHLTDLPRGARTEFLTDLSLLGEAVMTACNGLDPNLRRLNYEILGNTDQTYLHAHVFPRYAWEAPELLTRPVWDYPVDRWTSPRDAYSEEHFALREAITAHLLDIMADAYSPVI